MLLINVKPLETGNSINKTAIAGQAACGTDIVLVYHRSSASHWRNKKKRTKLRGREGTRGMARERTTENVSAKQHEFMDEQFYLVSVEPSCSRSFDAHNPALAGLHVPSRNTCASKPVQKSRDRCVHPTADTMNYRCTLNIVPAADAVPFRAFFFILVSSSTYTTFESPAGKTLVNFAISDSGAISASFELSSR